MCKPPRTLSAVVAFGASSLLSDIAFASAQAGGAAAAPAGLAAFGIPAGFSLFGLTLLGAALLRHRTFSVAATGLGENIGSKRFFARSAHGARYEGLGGDMRRTSTATIGLRSIAGLDPRTARFPRSPEGLGPAFRFSQGRVAWKRRSPYGP
jgi:hypothetical protein